MPCHVTKHVQEVTINDFTSAEKKDENTNGNDGAVCYQGEVPQHF